MVMQMDSMLREGSLDLGRVVSAMKLLNIPTLDLTLTMSFVGIPVVSMHVSLTREDTSLEKTMAPFGDLIQRVIRPGSGHNE